ncbi:hypothetical protein ACTFIW_008755 [Dictyostelium discoideum]
MSSNRREMLELFMAYQALLWSDTEPISSVRTTLETMPQKKVNLIGEHIPGLFNVKADHLSRLSEINHKSSSRVTKSYNWQLKKEVFNRIQLQFGQIQMDLFASHLNHQTINYSTYLRASKGRRKPHLGDSVFIQNEGKPLDDKEINIIVLLTLSSSGIDISKFKSHSTRSAMASLLLSNNVPFHVFKKMSRWKSNDTVDTFYDKRIICEKFGGFLNTVVQIS